MTEISETRRSRPPRRRAVFLTLSVATLALMQTHAPVAAREANRAEPARLAAQIDTAALRAAATGEDLRRFYEANGWQPVWNDTTAAALRRALEDRARHGLDRVSFLSGDVGGGAALEVARTRAALRYAEALGRGLVDPGAQHSIYTLPRPQLDAAEGLRTALGDGRLEQWLNGLAPDTADYRQLSEAYRRLADEARAQGRATIADKGLIHAGDSDPRVPKIVAALEQSEYLFDGEVPDTSGTQYTSRIADAVKRLQRDYGIREDGIVGPDTLQVLNLGPGDRARALAVALERMRWLSRNPPARRIDVNTAAAQLRYYRDGRVVDTRKVIVGEPGNETPLLRSPIYRLVAHPTWTVPKSIENNELAGLGAGALAARNMERRGGWIVQKPGPDNALGLVKFDMRNEHAIYLHDTNARQLLDRSQRHLSHGCVRVEDALGFARRIAEEEGIVDAWQRARDTGEETFVSLPEEIPVRLIYHNVFVDQAGEIAFRTDPYGWNGPIAEKLGFRQRTNKQARTGDAGGVGP